MLTSTTNISPTTTTTKTSTNMTVSTKDMLLEQYSDKMWKTVEVLKLVSKEDAKEIRDKSIIKGFLKLSDGYWMVENVTKHFRIFQFRESEICISRKSSLETFKVSVDIFLLGVIGKNELFTQEERSDIKCFLLIDK